jgi:HAMP domain-containing protein
MSPKRRASIQPTIAAAPSSDYPAEALGVGSPMLAPETEYANGERDLGPSAEVEQLATRFGELEAELEAFMHAVDARRGAR